MRYVGFNLLGAPIGLMEHNMRSKPNHIHLIAILIATLICVAQPEMVLGKDAIDGKR